jgi:hypothetical protein
MKYKIDIDSGSKHGHIELSSPNIFLRRCPNIDDVLWGSGRFQYALLFHQETDIFTDFFVYTSMYWKSFQNSKVWSGVFPRKRIFISPALQRFTSIFVFMQ